MGGQKVHSMDGNHSRMSVTYFPQMKKTFSVQREIDVSDLTGYVSKVGTNIACVSHTTERTSIKSRR